MCNLVRSNTGHTNRSEKCSSSIPKYRHARTTIFICVENFKNLEIVENYVGRGRRPVSEQMVPIVNSYFPAAPNKLLEESSSRLSDFLLQQIENPERDTSHISLENKRITLSK